MLLSVLSSYSVFKNKSLQASEIRKIHRTSLAHA